MVMDNSETVAQFVAEERIWITPDNTAFFGEEPPSGSRLLAAPGSEVSRADVEQYGLQKKAAQNAAEDKAVPSAAENKAKRSR